MTNTAFDAWLRVFDAFLESHDTDRGAFDAADVEEAFNAGTGPRTAAAAFARSQQD